VIPSFWRSVKSDALFSYRPPFNILALVVLKPASWILTPRALHSLNVFLIKLTSFPILIVIGLYERHFSAGQRFRESGKGAAQSFFSSLPRHIKNMPIVEALVGSSSTDLYEAIFDVELPHELDLFESEDDHPAIHAIRSYESLRPGRSRQRPSSHSRSFRDSEAYSPLPSPRAHGSISPGHFLGASEQQGSLGGRSPLTRLFAPRLVQASQSEGAIVEHVDAAVKKIESLLHDIRELPVRRLRDEMKELQVKS
jgi:hypothetical protein